MPSVAVYNSEGKEVKKIDLNPSVFDEEINLHSVRAAVNRQLARRRQGNAATKSRGMVSASNAKPWSQKGTGRARAGRTSSPIWRGGGTVFGPQPHKYGGRLNRKVTRKAIVSCLTSLAAAEREIIVIDDIQLPEPKTRQVIDLLTNLKIEAQRVLILTDVTNVNLALSARNIPYVDVINCDNINTYDLTTHDVLIATTSAIERLEEVYSK